MTHRLLVDEQTFLDIRDGARKFDIRDLDYNFQVGDVIKYRIELSNGCFRDDDHHFVITYILKNAPGHGLHPDSCIIGIEKDAYNETIRN